MALMQRYTRSQFVYSTYGRPTLISAFIQIGEIEPSTLVLGGVTYTAVVPGTGGDAISVEYLQFTPAVAAVRIYQDITYTADTAGAAGNSITITYTAGATAGAEVVSVVGTAISVQIESGVSTATQVQTAVNASIPAAALVNLVISGTAGNAQVAAATQALAGGANAVGAAGSEVVSVVGNAISVRLQSGVSTITQVRTAVNASGPAAALVTASGTSGTTVTAPVAATFLSNGDDGNTEDNGGTLVESIERIGVGEYEINLKGTYHSTQFLGFQLGLQTPQNLVPQINNLDPDTNNQFGVVLLNGTTPTDAVGGGLLFMKLILNNSSVG